MKKGQITIFIMIFLVLLVGFGFVFYLLSQTASDTTRASKQALIEEIKARTSLEQQMQECLNVGLKKSLQLIGDQGGFIYKDQIVNDLYYGNLVVGTGDGVDLPDEWAWDSTVGRIPIYLSKPSYVPAGMGADSNTYPYLRAAYEAPLYPCLSWNAASTNLDQPLIAIRPGAGLDCEQLYDYTKPISSLSYPIWLDQNQQVRRPVVAKDCSSDARCNQTIQSYIEQYSSAYFEACFRQIEIPGFDVRLEGDAEIISEFSFTTVKLGVEPELVVEGADGDFSFSFPRVDATPVLFKLETFFAEFNQLMLGEATIADFNLIEEADQLAVLPTLRAQRSLILNGTHYGVRMTLSGGDANIYGVPFSYQFVLRNRPPVLVPITTPYDASDPDLVVCAADPDREFFNFLEFKAEKLDGEMSVPSPISGVPLSSSDSRHPDPNLACVLYDFSFPFCWGGCSSSNVKISVSDTLHEDWQIIRVNP